MGVAGGATTGGLGVAGVEPYGFYWMGLDFGLATGVTFGPLAVVFSFLDYSVFKLLF